jgi:sulfur carrier protein
MKIRVNGEFRALETPSTLREFLLSLNLPTLERGVAVCINGEVVRKAEWAQTRINPDDELEIVNATQGG